MKLVCQHCGSINPHTTLEERFWNYVDKSKECWEWVGGLSRHGYGKTRNKTNAHTSAHRLSYEIAHGEIPEGLFVCHKCDNRKCVRPDHLFLGTRFENAIDMVSKGRAPNGQKLLTPQVRNDRQKDTTGIICQTCGLYNPHNTIEERFWSQVDKSSECWIWVGNANNKNYGVFNHSTVNGKRMRMFAHRMSYSLVYDDLSEEVVLCHKCDNSLCVRPDHLFVGTQAENMKDMVSKGRSLRGMKNHNNKLTEEQVQAIRLEYALGELGYTLLGRRYGVTGKVIRDIIKGYTWRYLPQPTDGNHTDLQVSHTGIRPDIS